MARNELWVYGPDLAPLAVIPSAESVIFTRSFSEIGEFQLTMSAARSEGAPRFSPVTILRARRTARPLYPPIIQ